MNENEKKETEQSSVNSFIQLWRRIQDGTFGEIIDDWRWIFTYSLCYKGAIAFYLIMGVLSTTLGLAGSVASKYLIDIITGKDTGKLVFLVIIMIGSIVFSLVFQSVLGRVGLKLNIRINNDIQADIFDKIVDADYLELSRFSNGDILNRFNKDIETVSGNAITWLPSIILAVYRLIATFCVILYYDKIMAVFALASAPVLLLFSKVLLKKQREYGKKVRQMSSDMMSFETESFYQLDTIKAFGVTGLYSKRLRNWQERYKQLSLDYNMFTIKTNILLSIFGAVISGAAFFYCLWRLWTDAITYGTMTLFLAQKDNLSSAFRSAVEVVPVFLNSSISAHRVRELVQLKKEEHIWQSRELDEELEEGLTVSMEQVSFSYTEDRKVISASDFRACPGEIIALVGPSGQGKTTLLRLFLGLVHPLSGEVSLKSVETGKTIRSNAETRHLFSYVPQGNTLLSGTIADNMRLAKEGATPEEIQRALQDACAWEFVEQLPQGTEYKVGERGRGLSEGQAQRLAIARALLRDAPILLLDEATSALDADTEQRVLENIRRKRPDKTCIVTTHRPGVLEISDRIYRVMDGQVLESSAWIMEQEEDREK